MVNYSAIEAPSGGQHSGYRTQEETGAVHWAFDGVSEQPVPACRECCEKLRLKVWKVDAKEPKDLPVRADCVYCGIPLPSADTRSVVSLSRGVNPALEHRFDELVEEGRAALARMG